MGSKADFYIGIDEKADWIGTLFKNGSVWKIPTDILIQVNKIMFEEMVIEFLSTCDSVIRDRHEKWDHPWEDSRCTDYVYMFDLNREKVLMYQMFVPYLVDPVKIKQGRSIEESIELYGVPSFPKMIKVPNVDTDSILEKYGFGLTTLSETKF